MARQAEEEWRTKTLAFAATVNAFVEEGLRDGWEHAGEEPKPGGREHLVEVVLDAVRDANARGELVGLQERWPPAHEPFADLLGGQGQSIPVVCVLPDGSIVARAGAAYEDPRTVRLVGDDIEELSVGFFGRCPNRRFFAIAEAHHIVVRDGWDGPVVTSCPWPSGVEGVPAGCDLQPHEGAWRPTQLIPFPDGKRVLLVAEGVFVVSASGAVRILPTNAELAKRAEWQRTRSPGEAFTLSLSMQHGAISRDGNLIAVGWQDSAHLVFGPDLELLAEVGNLSEYPHCAAFAEDGTTVAFNSCHFYNGVTVGVATADLPGLRTEPYEEHPQVRLLEDGSRVYAAVSRGDELILGDAYGYLRAVSMAGERRWQLFIGSSVTAIDISANGRSLVVATCAGFIVLLQLDGGQAPFQIGNSQHRELRRWLFWKGEPRALIW